MEQARTRKYHLRKTRNKTSDRFDYILLGIILAIAAAFRFWKLGQVPFMHDEFSALFRTQYDNLRDLFVNGIIVDAHPAGVQLFLYYWTKIVGWNEFWVKMPFALAGVASIFLIYLIGRQWFNSKVGLFSAAFFAVSQFTIFYSQIARPYSFGLFFVLLETYFWYKIVFQEDKPKVSAYVWFAIAAWLAALMHSFSTAQAGLIFLTGLFFIPKERRKAYLISGLAALLVYSPNLPIFYRQLFLNGGVGGWLGKPQNGFLIDFIRYTMNYSTLFMFCVGIVILLPIIVSKVNKRKYPIRWIAFAWFIIIFALAYFYSVLREPIIQKSTLLFCFPFVIIAAFSLFRNNTTSMAQTAIIVTVLLFVGATSLIINRNHYELMYKQGFDQIAVEMQRDNEKFKDIRFATHSESSRVAEFYQKQTNVERRIIFDLNNKVCDFRNWMENDTTSMMGFGWTDWADPNWEVQAVAEYPYVMREKTWFTSRYLTLSKKSVEGSTNALKPIGDTAIRYDHQEWGKAVEINGDSIGTGTDILGIVADFSCSDSVKSCIMVIEVHDAATDSIILWHGSNAEDGNFGPGKHTIVDGIRFENGLTPQGKTIKTYIWNQGKSELTVNRYGLYLSKKNPALTGLYDPLH